MGNSKGMKLSQIDAIIELQKLLERNKQSSCDLCNHKGQKKDKHSDPCKPDPCKRYHVNHVTHVVHAIYVLKLK